ncbi:hypothetical protein MMC17_006386 [Xylographa soralifera]|nr:hypothetical protein [Xylographa soralifera]
MDPIDWKRQAWGFVVPSYPVILGAGTQMTRLMETGSLAGDVRFHVSGVVAEIGPCMTAFKPDDRFADAFSSSDISHAAFQTYTVVSAASIAGLPPATCFQQGAPLSTAGSASSVGSMAIQLAHLAGLTVFTAASERHHAHLRALGASVLVDYYSPTAVDNLVAAAERTGN